MRVLCECYASARGSDATSAQLRDPYYKYCSATGSGLFKTVAGVSTRFYLQCRDAFGEPANGASFLVEIKGEVTLRPSPVPTDVEGQYKCEYTPSKVGQYEVTIRVGRGGGEYMDVIEGQDLEPNNDVHEYVFRPASRLQATTTPQVFHLTVDAGETDAATSVAVGEPITVSTAGGIGTFLITARDAFGNRRPGGEVLPCRRCSVLVNLFCVCCKIDPPKKHFLVPFLPALRSVCL